MRRWWSLWRCYHTRELALPRIDEQSFVGVPVQLPNRRLDQLAGDARADLPQRIQIGLVLRLPDEEVVRLRPRQTGHMRRALRARDHGHPHRPPLEPQRRQLPLEPEMLVHPDRLVHQDSPPAGFLRPVERLRHELALLVLALALRLLLTELRPIDDLLLDRLLRLLRPLDVIEPVCDDVPVTVQRGHQRILALRGEDQPVLAHVQQGHGHVCLPRPGWAYQGDVLPWLPVTG